jgi:hypothetical protein
MKPDGLLIRGFVDFVFAVGNPFVSVYVPPPTACVRNFRAVFDFSQILREVARKMLARLLPVFLVKVPAEVIVVSFSSENIPLHHEPLSELGLFGVVDLVEESEEEAELKIECTPITI